MSVALEQPQGCTGARLGCSRARDIFGSLQPSPETTTCSFPYRLSGKSRNSGLVPGNRDCLNQGLNKQLGKDNDSNGMANTSNLSWIFISCATCTSVSYLNTGL